MLMMVSFAVILGNAGKTEHISKSEEILVLEPALIPGKFCGFVSLRFLTREKSWTRCFLIPSDHKLGFFCFFFFFPVIFFQT